MSEEPLKNLRVTLGPELSKFVRSLDDQSAPSLDIEFLSLIEARNRTKDLEDERAANRATITSLLEQVGALSAALGQTSASVSNLTDMMDHRTREMITVFVHISSMVGTKFAQGEELEHIHRRFTELNNDLERQMEELSGLLKEQQAVRENTVQSITGRAEEERLSLAEQQDLATSERASKERGFER